MVHEYESYCATCKVWYRFVVPSDPQLALADEHAYHALRAHVHIIIRAIVRALSPRRRRDERQGSCSPDLSPTSFQSPSALETTPAPVDADASDDVSWVK